MRTIDSPGTGRRSGYAVIGVLLAQTLLVGEALGAGGGIVYLSNRSDPLPLYTDKAVNRSSQAILSSRALTPRPALSGDTDEVASKREPFERLIERTARVHGVEAALLFAMIE